MSGWRKIDTKFLDWRWAHRPEYVSFALHCILKANPRPKPFENIELQRGQFAISLDSFSREIGVSVQTLRTMIKNCVNCGFITKKSTNGFTVLTLCNYEKYQSTENKTNKQSTNDQQATNIPLANNQQLTNNQLTTTLEYKNIEIENKESIKEKIEKNAEREDLYSYEILLEYVKAHNVNITDKGIREFKKFNDTCKNPYMNGDLQMAFENWLEKKWNKKFKKVSGPPPPAVVTVQPPPQPLTLEEIAAKVQFHKDAAAKWDKVMDSLSEILSFNEVRTFFGPIKVNISEDNKQMQIICTKFLMETIEQKYATELKQAILKNFKQMPKVSYKCS